MSRSVRRLAAFIAVLYACDTPPTAPPLVASVRVTPTAATLQVGQTEQLSATTLGSDGTALSGRTITWSSSDVAVASVSTSGLVTAVKPGSALVSATSEGKTGSVAVTVPAPPTITLALSAPKAFVGDSVVLTWSTLYTTDCTASGAWSGTQLLAGSRKVARTAGGVTYFVLACTGPGGAIRDSIRLIVPLPVFPTSNENARAYVLPYLNPSVSPFATCSYDNIQVQNERAYADFLQNGTLTMVGNPSGRSGPTPVWLRGPICFWQQSANGAWTEITSQLIGDEVGCAGSRKSLVADFNGDRKPDVFFACTGADHNDPNVAVTGQSGEESFLLLSRPDGRYQKGPPLGIIAYAHGASAGDVNGDGFPDILFANGSALGVPPNQVAQYLTILINNRDGTFTRDDSRLSLPPWAINKNLPTIELIDVDADGALDAVFAGNDAEGFPVTFPLTILWGNQAGVFNSRPPRQLPILEGWPAPHYIHKIGDYLYVLRVKNGGCCMAIQKISIATWASQKLWDEPIGFTTFGRFFDSFGQFFVFKGKFIHDWVVGLSIDP